MNDYFESIKQYRKKAGLTQKDVERQLGLRSLAIKDYETGRLKLPIEMARQLAALYGVEVSALLNLNEESDKSSLTQLSGLWEMNFFQLITFDPVIRADLEDRREFLREKSILEILLMNLTKSQKKEFVEVVTKLINSLIGIDGKIENSELELRNQFLLKFDEVSLSKKLNKYLGERFVPSNVPGSLQSASLKHFVIWLLFFISDADKEIDYREVDYIEKVAEAIRVTKINYEMIRENFVRGL